MLFFFAFLLLALYGVLRIFAPFSGALLSAFCLALTFYPVQTWLRRRLPRRSDSVYALIMTFMVLVALILPLTLLGWSVMAESAGLSQVMKTWPSTVNQWSQGNFGTQNAAVDRIQDWMQKTLGMGPADIQNKIAQRMDHVLGSITGYGALVAQHALAFILHVFLMLFALFFFFRDGTHFTRRFADLFPLPAHDTQGVIQKTQDIVTGVVRGWFLTSLVQGTLATLGYFIIHLNGAILLGMMTAMIGLLPVVGTIGVWVPVALFLFAKGSIGEGLFVLLWGAFIVVGLIDTWVRPYLIGQRVELPLFPLFFALLGGVEAFGIQGVVLGPWLMAITPLLLDIYHRRYQPARTASKEA
jgi:predicted PurR-regulated permease PerM